MKNTLKILLLILTSTPVFASESETPILTKFTSAGARPPKYRNDRRVEVFPSGKVSIVSHKGLKNSETTKKLSEEEMDKILDCKKSMAKEKGVDFPNCAGSSSTAYYLGSKRIHIRSCGEIATAKGDCVHSMINLLDRL